jgi:hypothetical protein
MLRRRRRFVCLSSVGRGGDFLRKALPGSCCLCSSRLPGGGITFFAAAKKVIKESRFFNQTLQIDTTTGLSFARRLFVASALIIHSGLGTHTICIVAPSH